MCDHDDDPAALTHAHDCIDQRVLALGIEIRVGFVQHHEERPSVERARKPDALALSSRERGPAVTDAGLVPLRQPQDHLMRAGFAGRFEDIVRLRIGVETPDILRNAPVEQLDILRQVTDVPAELRRSHWSIEAPSRHTRPLAAGQTPISVRASVDFPEALGPMMARPCPAFIPKETFWMIGFSPPGATA